VLAHAADVVDGRAGQPRQAADLGGDVGFVSHGDGLPAIRLGVWRRAGGIVFAKRYGLGFAVGNSSGKLLLFDSERSVSLHRHAAHCDMLCP
jgi:hypothetical protein